MNLFGIGDKKTKQIVPKIKNVQELTPEERAEIEDQTADGARASEIADALGLDVKVVYSYRRIIKERAANKPENTAKEILSSKLTEREILKADYELEKLRLDLEQKHQQLEFDRLEFQKTLKEWKEDINQGEDDDIGFKDLLSLFNGALAGGQRTPKAPIQTKDTSNIQSVGRIIDPPQDTDPTPETKEQDPEPEDQGLIVSDEEIKRMIEQFDKKQIKIAKAFPDTILFDKIAEKFPTVSDESINRAIQLLRTEY